MTSRGASSKKISGLSRAAIRHGFHGSSRRSQVLVAGKQTHRMEEAAVKRQMQLQEMSLADRDAVEMMISDVGVDIDTTSHTAPPGEEGMDLSHEGGEHEAFDGLSQQISSMSGYRYVDPRTRHDRIEIQTGHWNTQLDRLVDAYLDYRTRSKGNGMPNTPETDVHLTDCLPLAEIELVDLFGRQRTALQPQTSHIYPNETLIYHGYLGCSPVHPTVAISLRTLAAYRQSHRTCPRFSIQAQCKTLCHLHDVPYRPYLNMQFSAAYDAYLEILHCVNKRLNEALGRNIPNWRLLNACPCCFYKLEGERPLAFEWLVTIDGNNSLKRWASSTYGMDSREDSRRPRSDYWVDRTAVNKFQNEVRPCASGTASHPRLDDWEDVGHETQGSGLNCTDRWRNAGPEQHKKMFAVFEESGIFIAACRHRFVLLACDMVQSGELAKYPLALLNHLMSVFGEKGGCAYDIGCAFAKTLANSSLGPRAAALDLRLMVGAFHGHAHNRRCQLDWHPMYINGTGHTEGEGCEHVFSASNELARSTRHASAFHRHQTIEEHFAFWDADKYATLSNFLRNHYREALSSIKTLTDELSILKDTLGLTDADFVRFHSEERAYLDGLKNPPPRELLQIRYVEVLDELAERRLEWELAREAGNQALTNVAAGDLTQISTALSQARIRVDGAYAKLQNAEAFTAHIEMQLQVEERWEIGGDAYKQYKQEASLRQYRVALDELERLVVMRLFELSKLSLSGTGYKLRQQIGKALQRRSDAIRNAISRYNVQAAKLNPPRPQLSWKNITEYSFLGEFDLLRQSRSDVRELDWAKPAHREATVKYFKLCRAYEEIERLNVEVRRLRTSIHDEEVKMTTVISELLVSNPSLGFELQRQWTARAAVNAVHALRLDQIELQPGFSGTTGVGVRLGAVGSPSEANSVQEQAGEVRVASDIISSEYADENVLEHEEELQITQDIADFIASIVN